MSGEDIASIYEDIAGWFDRNRSRALEEKPYLDQLRAFAPDGGSLLDLGCGTGEPLARYFIDHGFQVTGVDAAAAMTGIARERFPQQEWICADIRRLALGRSFDVILAWDSFFHLPPQAQRDMFGVFARHSHAGSMLCFTSGTSAGEVYGEMQGHRVYHASLDVEEYRGLLAQNGFSVVRLTRDDAACGGHTVWIAQKQ